ncbi:MAG: NUDIX domain-containing protein [Bacteroidota bacterium]
MSYQAAKIWLAVDCLVFGYDVEEECVKILLFKRTIDPFAGQWSLIGSFVEPEEPVHSAAARILHKFTGLENVYLEQIHAFGRTERDPAGRVVSILYWSIIKLDQIKKDIVQRHHAAWFKLGELPELVLDHEDMVDFGKNRLLQLAERTPIGFELLPQKFTLPQLLRLYESIYGVRLDDRNFRKKMLSTGLLTKLSEKDKSTSKRGAFLYQFAEERYRELSHSGYFMDFLKIKSSKDAGQ